jgi:hypothetical protein
MLEIQPVFLRCYHPGQSTVTPVLEVLLVEEGFDILALPSFTGVLL